MKQLNENLPYVSPAMKVVYIKPRRTMCTVSDIKAAIVNGDIDGDDYSYTD